jgi:wyosine [tRNA(Phe)-imidazoG37] synthetase (radical SAM superfamily)
MSERRAFYTPDEVFRHVQERVKKAVEQNEAIDFVSFVPDGEPTLDVNLGKEIELLKPLGVKIAVISNSSLMWREDVREDLIDADWVSVKIDATTEKVWRNVNRPHGNLDLDAILAGVMAFADEYEGFLATETMMIKGLNDREEARNVAKFLGELDPDKAYISIPTRPPAESWVQPADEDAVNRAYQIFAGELGEVECLIGYEGNAFASTGDVEADMLSITSVHPMREEGVRNLLSREGAEWETIERLIREEKLVELNYMGNKFYMRKIPSRTTL